MTPPLLRIPADHPALPGHFPGYPLVPAVVILDAVLQALQQERPQLTVNGVRKLKILRPLRPGEAFSLRWEPSRRGGLRFHCEVGGEALAEGHLQLDEA